MLLKRILSRYPLVAALMLALLPLHGHAQQFEQVGDYQIHYSAVSTSFLPQEVAEAHGIQRSPAMALLNVSVLEEVDGQLRPVNAPVSGTFGELQGQDRTPLEFRTLREGDAQSQIALFRMLDDEPMHFALEVRYDRNREPAEVNFVQRFHIER
ncbi:DUF4426 domain-containing protein [Billgrantia kenyensis]|uniref:DUF4426 domain-containing protein n=1 Tax=Billgrantia kenyensis TaxID=321266 RepID=UPI001EF0581A|nr:DUF4426 domain-containing protein [Halomonas kenyensis]